MLSLRTYKYKKNAAGTTLIELIIYIAISAGLITGVGVVALNMLDAKTKTQAMGNVLDGATFSFGRLGALLDTPGTLISPLPAMASSGLLYLPDNAPYPLLVTISGGRLLLQNGGVKEYLTPENTRVEQFAAESSGNAATSTGVRVAIVLSSAASGTLQAFRYKETFSTTYFFGH